MEAIESKAPEDISILKMMYPDPSETMMRDRSSLLCKLLEEEEEDGGTRSPLVALSSSESSPTSSSSTCSLSPSPHTTKKKDGSPGDSCDAAVSPCTTTTPADSEKPEKPTIAIPQDNPEAAAEKTEKTGFSPIPVFFGGDSWIAWQKAAQNKYKIQRQAEDHEEEEEQDVARRAREVMSVEASGLVAEDLSKPSTRAYIEPEIIPRTDDEWMGVWRQAFDDLQDTCTDPARAYDAYGRRTEIEKSFFTKEDTDTIFRPWHSEPGNDVPFNSAFRYSNGKYAIAQRMVITDEVEKIDKRNADEQELCEYFSLKTACKRTVDEAATITQCAGQITRLEGLVTKFETEKKHDRQAEMYALLRQCKEKKEKLEQQEEEKKKKEEEVDSDKPEALLEVTNKLPSVSNTRPVVQQFDRSLKNHGPASKNRKKKHGPNLGEEEEKNKTKRYAHCVWKASFTIEGEGTHLPMDKALPHATGFKMKVDPDFIPAVEKRDITPPPPETSSSSSDKGKEEEEEKKVYRYIHQFDRIPDSKADATLLTTNTEDNSGYITTWRQTGIKITLPATFGGTERELVVVNHEQVRIFDMPACKENAEGETYYIVPEAVVKAKKNAREPSNTLFKSLHVSLSDAYILLLGYFVDCDVPALLCVDRQRKIMTMMLTDVVMSCVTISTTQPHTALIGLCDGMILRVDLRPNSSSPPKEPQPGATQNQGKKKKKPKKSKKKGILHQEVLLYPLSEKSLPEHYKEDSDYYAQFCTHKQVTVVPLYMDPERRSTRTTLFAGSASPIKRIVERNMRVVACSHEGLHLFRLQNEWKEENIVTMMLTQVATFTFMGNLLIAHMYDNSIGYVELQSCKLERIDGAPMALKPAPPPTTHNVESVVMHDTSIIVFHGDTTRRVISLRNAANIGLHDYGKPRTEAQRQQSFLAPSSSSSGKAKKIKTKGKNNKKKGKK